MAWDYSKLLGKIKEKYGTQDKFAKELGMSATTLNLKLNNKLEFTQKQMFLACDLLNIDRSKTNDYFFEQLVKQV
ncbi:DUF739 family protein [Peptostreptococcus equinus]|uniref:DUF739 family protein n=1 Tax=Peptostreptococcus equinus TaxID=3003601 RepID=A0ABY7JNG9_9FIRM|nr:DUF739 family protein [Peptostreptococcus sp. CBA3647]WAW14645.1 DUF739 family protein [Peptostreptococcus sp. CBA3647]